jgi:tetratricopeptide (TPR) repeat protein
VTGLKACAAVLVLASAGAGRAVPTPESCRELRKHGRQSEATSCFDAVSRSADPAVRAEGFWGLEQWEKANEAFRLAAAQPGSKAVVRVRWGILLHQRFNDAEAADLFGEALKQDPGSAEAYLGLAEVSVEDSKAADYAKKALALDSKLVEAHEFLANLDLQNLNTREALDEADKALALSNEALEAMGVHAAADVLADRKPDAWFAKIAAVNPSHGDGYALVGYHLVMNRRYEDGVSYYRKAIAVDPKLWAAHSQLGINLMRLGQEQEPFKELELAYDNGQKDAATVNSLRLLDSYKNFETFRDDTTILRLRKNEADLLRPYFEAELHKAMATYNAKYKMTLPGPVQVEVYPDHEDFAVRTMGMPGLGALGVTFGEVVAMDSPSGRKPGDFNWGSTLWHEMSHVYILSATNHRVPRWFTEGLAVHEEGQANPEWANRLSPEVLAAIRDKKLLPVAEIDRGFIFPQYPSQVIVSYFEAGSMCDFIQQRWGDDALLGMVHSFAAIKTTPQAIEENLKLTPEEFDKAYLAWLEKQVGTEPADFDKWREGLKTLVGLAKDKNNDAMVQQAPAVLKLYPEYVGDASVYEFLSAAQTAKGDKAGAQATLTAYEKMGGESPELLTRLATLQEDAGDKKAAADTLNRINFIYPESENLHRHLGQLWLAQGNHAGAVREFTAVLALKPLDKASAEFDLAQAYFAQGDKAKAEENVLAALEVAPGFRPAQKLLMEIEGQK